MSHRMEFESGSPHRTTQSEYSRSQTKLTGSSTASQQTSRIFEAAAASLNRGNALQKREFGSVLRASESLDLGKQKMNEKELLHGLNDRFAGFIEKVRDLEHQNQLLEREIEDIRQKAQSSSSLAQKYEPELRDLRKQVNDITHQKRQIEIEHHDLEEEVVNLRAKYDQEACYRSDAESNMIVLEKDINDTYLAKLQLDKKAQSMVDEIHFLKKNHEIEVSEMLAQMQETRVKVEELQFGKPDITEALREIRAQLEGVSDIQQADKCFHAQFAKLNKAAETKREALKATKQEIQEHKRRLQEKNIELDCAKGTREALANQLDELEDCHNAEMVHYQDTIRELENELTNAKFDMSGHLREHQDLLNVNLALDVEILSFRQLLDGEESRQSTISDTHISMQYIYHQSPVYTPPCLAQDGGPTRRVEPQKFVEEIITETIRQVEMSELEETRSEETVGGEEVYQRKGEEHDKSERGRNDKKEEEEEDKTGLCEENLEKEDASTKHGDDISPAESEEGDEGKEETGDEPDKVDRKEDTVKPIQSEVKSVETTSDEEQDQRYTAEDTDSEQFQKDDQEAPIDNEISKEPQKSETKDNLKQSALKEKKELDMKEESASAEEQQGSKKESPLKESPLIESKEVYLKKDITPLLEQTAELESTDLKEAVTVQEEAVPVLSEETSTDKTTVEVTTEIKTTPTKPIWEPVKSSEDTKAAEIQSTRPEKEEKASSPTEPKLSSKDESLTITEEESVEITKDETQDVKHLEESPKSLYKTLPKPDLTAIPKEAEIKETSSEEKAMAGAEESIIPDKTTAVIKSKDSHSMAPDSNVTQGDKAQEITRTPEKEEKAPSRTEPKVISKDKSLKTTEEDSVKITKDEIKDENNLKESVTSPKLDLTAIIKDEEMEKASKSPEKKMSPKEPQVSSKDESVNTNEEEIPKGSVKITKDETKDDLISEKKVKESETLPKPELSAIPKKAEIKETRSEEKAIAGAEESIIPDQTTAVTESKDSHSMAPGSNVTQHDKAQEMTGAPEKEEKASSPTVPKDASFKTTEEDSVKITKDETKDETFLKESATSPKPDLTAIPKDEEMEKAPKSLEKETSPKEPKRSSKDESVKINEEEIPKGSVKITKDETKDALIAEKQMKESEILPKPDLTAIPKEAEIKETSSEEKAIAGAEESIIPDQTTAVTEGKDSHSMAPDSNVIQGDEAQVIARTPEKEEKAPSRTEPKVISKDRSLKTTEEDSVKITKDETKDETFWKDSATSPKLDLTAIPKDEEMEKASKSPEKKMSLTQVSSKDESIKTTEEEIPMGSVIPSTPERAEKALSPTEPKVISKDESLKTTEEDSVNITKDEIKDENNLKESATSPKLDLTAIIKDEEMEKASKSPEKKMSPIEPQVSNKDDSIKTTEEEIPMTSVKITKDETKDDLISEKKVKESETLPKPELSAIPKEAEIKETRSEEKAIAGAEESIIPDQTTAVTESKDSHSMAPGSNVTQHDKAQEMTGASEKEEKASSPTVPKDASFKTTEEDSVKITKDETKDETFLKESATSPKPDLTAIPKDEEMEKAPKSLEKETSPKEPKGSIKDESVKINEEEIPKGSVKITKDETKDALIAEKKMKESEILPKPDLTAIPKEAEIKETSSEEKAMAGAEESIIPDKTTAVTESKDSHSMAPDSNVTQHDKAQEITRTPEKEEKAHSRTEPKVISKDESLKTTEEDSVKITKDETKDETFWKDSATSPKLDLTAIPKDEEMEKASKSPEKKMSLTQVSSKDESIKTTEEEIPMGSVIPSTPERAEKALSPTETKVISKDKSLKTTEEDSVNITKDEIKDENNLKESATPPKLDLTVIIKDEEMEKASKSPEKKMSPIEPQVSSKDDSIKTTEEEIPMTSVKITKDETKDDLISEKKVKESETLPKPELSAIPKEVEIKETSSEEKAIAGAEESIIPDKATAVKESMDSHSMAPGSNVTQHDKAKEMTGAPEKEEKASSPTVPKDASFKTTEEDSVKITKDETKDETFLKESATSPKPDLTAIPKDEEMEKASKSPEKETSPKEPKRSSKDGSVKINEEEIPKGSVKITKDETKDALIAEKKMKESEILPKPDLTAITKEAEIKETSSEEKAIAGAEESIIPDQTTAVTESKDSHSMAPGSNVTQHDKAQEMTGAPEKEERESSPTEPKVISNDESLKTTEEDSVKITKDESKDETFFKETATSPKPDLTAITKGEEMEKASKSPEKKMSPIELQVSSKDDSIKTTEEEIPMICVKITKDETKDDLISEKKVKEPETFPKPDLSAIPKDEEMEKLYKSLEKKMSPTQVSSKDESIKTTEEEISKGSVKITKDETKDDLINEKILKESETLPKPDLTAIPKEENVKETSSGDKTITATEEFITTDKMKTTAVAESKDSHSLVPESNQTHGHKLQEIPSTTPDREEKVPQSPEKEISLKALKGSSRDESVQITEEETPKGSVKVAKDDSKDKNNFKESEISPKPDLTAIPKEEEKAPKSPEKEMSLKEPKVGSNVENVKTTEEETPTGSVKITKEKDETKDDLIAEKKVKESATFPKPELTAIPKEEKIKETSSGDKAMTGAEEFIILEKRSTVVESKHSHKLTPESNISQEKSEEPEKVNDPKDVPTKTVSVKTKESEVLIKSKKEAKPEQVEISITKTSPLKDDVSAMGLKEKAVDEKKAEEENKCSEDDGVSKDEKTESKMKEQAEPIKEQKNRV